MNKPSKEDGFAILFEALLTGDSNQAILNQEARGQTKLVNSDVLPKRILHGTRADLEQFGVIFGEVYDDLFINVTLPDGWKKQPTDHSMWSELVDDKCRKRASIFYKAAFYDRDAHLGVSFRYGVSAYESCDADGNIAEVYNEGTHNGTFITDCGNPIKLIAVRSKDAGYEVGDKHRELALNWLDENYPDHNNRVAYWD